MPLKAIQQFQIRLDTGTDEETKQALRAIREAGYDGIELCSFLITGLPVPIRIMARMAGMPLGRGGKLDWERLVMESGLKVIAIHEDIDSATRNIVSVTERAKTFGTDIVVIPGMHNYDYSNKQFVLVLAEKLNKAGKLFAERGIRMLYHNHNCELQKINGEYALRILLENTDPSYVNFEYDSYWAVETGCEPIGIMKMIGDRMKLYHINDRGYRPRGRTPAIVKSNGMELGYGNMDLVGLTETAKSYCVEAIILETQAGWVDKSSIKSLQLSAEFMNKYV
jgi:sugar phosphate isomerase/epimerase